MWSVWSVQNTERTVPSTHEIEIVLRNPSNKNDTLSYFIDVEDTDFNRRWLALLKNNLKNNAHLEKNYCWLGWADSPRDADYLCIEINKSITQINKFNATNIWKEAGLTPYCIDDYFSPELIIQTGTVGDGINNPGLRLNHNPMNRLHRYFEDLQGETWGISKYYKLADYNTKWAIRQLNILCHELETWVLTNRKKNYEPEWQRPSQITTFLNAPRQDLQDEDYELFLKTRYDREFGGVYLHWAQVGKTQFEVFRDEHGADIDAATCSAINSLKFYSGEFDVEWGRDVNDRDHDWHCKEQTEFREWLKRNGFDYNDPKLSLGYIKLGQINLNKSFGTNDFFKIIEIMSTHLDIYQIKTGDVIGTFDYVWSDDNYKQMQIDFLRPGYNWSKRNA
jgi:hypothetical protein